MWYEGSGIDVATSSDGISWTRSGNAGISDYGAFDAWVILENGVYKMWYVYMVGYGPVQQIGYATSTDGMAWARYSGNPVLAPGPTGAWDDGRVEEPTVVSIQGSYLMYYLGVSIGNFGATGIARSSDGIHWTKTSLTFPASKWDSITTPDVGGISWIGDTMIMSYTALWTQEKPMFEIGLAKSTDGINWAPYESNPVITYGTSDWDDGTLWHPMVVPVHDQLYVYYSVQNTVSQPGSRIGLAILPLSQYPIVASESAGESPSLGTPTATVMVSAATVAVMIGAALSITYVVRRRRKKSQTVSDETRVY
jgi:predicted GH43/DUF377 family glycosyl hydrolase